MTGAFADPLCAALFGSAPSAAVVVFTCAVVAALLLGLVVLGFGPLRDRLGWARGPSPAPWYEVGSESAWRLYRVLGRAAPKLPVP